MNNFLITFDIFDKGEDVPDNMKSLGVHLTFGVNMNLTYKAIIVACGNRSENRVRTTYEVVVSRETVSIVLTYSDLNGLDIISADIQNAYIISPDTEKHFIACGPEFLLENTGRKAIVKRSLYGMK